MSDQEQEPDVTGDEVEEEEEEVEEEVDGKFWLFSLISYLLCVKITIL